MDTNNKKNHYINTNPLQTTLYVKEKLQRGLNNFINHESFGGVLLFFCVVLAVIVANSSYKDLYFRIMDSEFGAFVGGSYVKISIIHFVNDVLMSLFFLMVGLEMKREVLYGELAGFKRVSFSILSALGGITVPIIIYLYFNHDTPSAHGFGVAMSTDTAFALGAILLLGKRIPRVVKIFLVTLAVFDDLGAILIIAFLYTNHFDMYWIYIAIVLVCILIYLNYRDTKYLSSYVFIGILLWIAIFHSGVHATIAGVILAFAIPGRSNIRKKYFISILNMLEEWNNVLLKEKPSTLPKQDFKKKGFFYDFFNGIFSFFKSDENKKIDIEETSKQVHMLDTIAKYSLYAQNPLVKMEIILQPICAYFIVPIFAFLNAGISLESSMNFNVDGILLGTILGLVIGKPFGILLFSFLGEKLNVAVRPSGLTYGHILAVGILGGVGFTMSIFVANLAFSNPAQVTLAKLSILIASLVSIMFGVIALFFVTKDSIQN
ncbi:Na+/H+ antiporter NhaA [Helicobacter sp. MIT 14-3879]|uniref:Na+/H+ antiporter NhaA n=1 Tax=Helicobacter sp. MIT 14-3879 TaxID=2040649 RepID=UPI000E1E2F01|nr:Na+/H+ antiporter NhaA [Helicobacter sp. MIT 14-3879]RDU62459.1 Na+/H+ antiporter NhaA [Helicobacter sp. MIT 14-3879]